MLVKVHSVMLCYAAEYYLRINNLARICSAKSLMCHSTMASKLFTQSSRTSHTTELRIPRSKHSAWTTYNTLLIKLIYIPQLKYTLATAGRTRHCYGMGLSISRL